MNKIECRCLFDITATGVTGHYKSSRVPFHDHVGQLIIDESTWHRARNQQRNWETLTQLISLRTQVIDLSTPIRHNNMWLFEFATETADVYGTADDPTAVLRSDAAGVPMIINLATDQIQSQELITTGPDQNIWFNSIAINS